MRGVMFFSFCFLVAVTGEREGELTDGTGPNASLVGRGLVGPGAVHLVSIQEPFAPLGKHQFGRFFSSTRTLRLLAARVT